MDYNKAALEMHETHHGKVGITSKVEVKTRDDLSTAYTPGVAEPCRKIKENPDDVYKYTFKGNMVAVVSNGTAVLGLGDIGPEAGLPVMEGKAVLFKEFGGVDAFPICIDAHDAASVIAACKAIAPTFGGINLEDIKSPECFEIEETLERELDIPVFHDDQHGTAIVVTAALINALRVVARSEERRVGKEGRSPLARVHPDFALGLFQAGAAFGDKGVEPFHEFPRETGKTSERRGFIFMSEGCLLLVVSGWGHGSVILWSCWLLEARTRGRGSPSCPS